MKSITGILATLVAFAIFSVPSVAGASLPMTSANWSGYVLTAGSGGYQSVGATWTVPSVDCASTPGGVEENWVGVNGWSSNGLVQTGTASYCGANGQKGAWTWWTNGAMGYSNQYLFAVVPGDVISARVFQDASGHWNYYVDDITSGSLYTAPTSFTGPGATAEWIVEDPGNPVANALYPPANFGSTTFADMSLSPPFSNWALMDSDAVTMETPGGSVKALPSTIQDASFTVTYEGAV